jgi:hypothetical protein
VRISVLSSCKDEFERSGHTLNCKATGGKFYLVQNNDNINSDESNSKSQTCGPLCWKFSGHRRLNLSAKNSNSDDFTYPAHQNIALRPSATNRLSSSESRKALLMAFGQVNMLL